MSNEYSNAERASPAQQRKALEIANLFVKAGIGFVPMPVANGAEFENLAQQTIERLTEMMEGLE